MKSEGVKDIVEWMEDRIKGKKESMENYSVWDDMGLAASELNVMISWKVSTEKYMKKLKYQGE